MNTNIQKLKDLIKAKDIYPELDTENHWHENLLDKLKNDKEHFGMEEFEPLCTYNSVP